MNATFQICLCGSQPGFPHATDCPRPLCHATAEQEKAWRDERARYRVIYVLAGKVLETIVESEPEGPVPLSPMYLALGADIALWTTVRAVLERAGLATFTAATASSTEKGRALVRASTTSTTLNGK